MSKTSIASYWVKPRLSGLMVILPTITGMVGGGAFGACGEVVPLLPPALVFHSESSCRCPCAWDSEPSPQGRLTACLRWRERRLTHSLFLPWYYYLYGTTSIITFKGSEKYYNSLPFFITTTSGSKFQIYNSYLWHYFDEAKLPSVLSATIPVLVLLGFSLFRYVKYLYKVSFLTPNSLTSGAAWPLALVKEGKSLLLLAFRHPSTSNTTTRIILVLPNQAWLPWLD